MTVSRTGRLAKAALFVVALALPAALPVPAASAANSLSVLGADVSTVQRALDLGAKYADATPNVFSASQPCAGYPDTPAGQAANFTAVQNTARGAGAIGIFYGEPAWYAVPGNGWENQAVFDRAGRLNPNVRWTP